MKTKKYYNKAGYIVEKEIKEKVDANELKLVVSTCILAVVIAIFNIITYI